MPQSGPSLVNMGSNASPWLFTQDNAELIRQNMQLREQIANAELIRQNMQLREHIALMSKTVASTHATVSHEEGRRTSNAASRCPLIKARAALVTSGGSLDRNAFDGSKGIADRSLMKQKRVHFFNHSCDASPTASTTASADGFSEAGESNDDEAIMDHDEFRTTVMMRNIPNEHTRADLLGLIDQEGFHGLYDLVYMPVDFKTELNQGYAFINFTAAESAERFREHFMGFSDWLVPSEQICELCWSEQAQGIDLLIQRYRDSPVMHESVADRFKPVLFQDGQRIPFPKPTKVLKAPRASRTRKQ
jgi:hypothetical protein